MQPAKYITSLPNISREIDVMFYILKLKIYNKHMPNYRRYYLDQPVFITCITNKRYPVFDQNESIELFWQVVRKVQTIHPFKIIAYVILPNHFHWIIDVQDKDKNFSRIMQSLKGNYSYIFRKKYPIISHPIWQRGYWDHILRDDNDFYNHLDYIHYNPVKHGYIDLPQIWEQSSLRQWIDQGYYELSWGSSLPKSIEKWDFE